MIFLIIQLNSFNFLEKRTDQSKQIRKFLFGNETGLSLNRLSDKTKKPRNDDFVK